MTAAAIMKIGETKAGVQGCPDLANVLETLRKPGSSSVLSSRMRRAI